MLCLEQDMIMKVNFNTKSGRIHSQMSHRPVFLTIDLSIDVIGNAQHDGMDALVSFLGKGDIYLIPSEILFQTVLNLIVVVNSALSDVKLYLHTSLQVRGHIWGRYAKIHLEKRLQDSHHRRRRNQLARLQWQDGQVVPISLSEHEQMLYWKAHT